jgi:hypothetical protein
MNPTPGCLDAPSTWALFPSARQKIGPLKVALLNGFPSCGSLFQSAVGPGNTVWLAEIDAALSAVLHASIDRTFFSRLDINGSITVKGFCCARKSVQISSASSN